MGNWGSFKKSSFALTSSLLTLIFLLSVPSVSLAQLSEGLTGEFKMGIDIKPDPKPAGAGDQSESEDSKLKIGVPLATSEGSAKPASTDEESGFKHAPKDKTPELPKEDGKAVLAAYSKASEGVKLTMAQNCPTGGESPSALGKDRLAVKPLSSPFKKKSHLDEEAGDGDTDSGPMGHSGDVVDIKGKKLPPEIRQLVEQNLKIDDLSRLSDICPMATRLQGNEELTNKLKVALVEAIIGPESGWDAAKSFQEPPPLGYPSVGLMQMSYPQDAQCLSIFSSAADLKDPRKNVECGVKTINGLIEKNPGEQLVVTKSSNGKHHGALGDYWSVTRPKNAGGFRKFKDEFYCRTIDETTGTNFCLIPGDASKCL